MVPVKFDFFILLIADPTPETPVTNLSGAVNSVVLMSNSADHYRSNNSMNAEKYVFFLVFPLSMKS